MWRSARFFFVACNSNGQRCEELQQNINEAMDIPRAECEKLRLHKASGEQLEMAAVSLKDAHFKLHEAHSRTTENLARAQGQLSALESYSREQFTHVSKLFDDFVTSTNTRFATATEQHGQLRVEHDQYSEDLGSLSVRHVEQAGRLKGFCAKDHNDVATDLGAFMQKMEARCDRLDFELKELDRRERSSWEQFASSRR